MLIKLIRNKANGSAITGRLVIDGRWFCNTLERTGYQILALCFPVRVTQSPKFKRLLPIVNNVPRALEGVDSSATLSKLSSKNMRQGIRFHVGTRPEHSTGCILVPNRTLEKELTQLLLKAQNAHEEIILEVIDYSPGTEYGYNTPCPRELQKP